MKCQRKIKHDRPISEYINNRYELVCRKGENYKKHRYHSCEISATLYFRLIPKMSPLMSTLAVHLPRKSNVQYFISSQAPCFLHAFTLCVNCCSSNQISWSLIKYADASLTVGKTRNFMVDIPGVDLIISVYMF